MAKTLGLVKQTLFNGVKTSRQGQLNGADSKPVSAEQMEIARLQAELTRVKMARDILGKGESAGRASSEWLPDERVLRQGLEALLRQVRYAFIQRHRQVWPITVQCRVLNVSISGYHGHVARRASPAPHRVGT